MSTNRIEAAFQIQTSETDTTLVLAPDGANGVEWRAETGGGPGNLDGGNASSTYGGTTAIDGGNA